MEFSHKSVLLSESINGLNIEPTGVYVDCTIGGGGHSLEICKRLTPKGKLIGIDQDINAINKASQVLADFEDRLTLVNGNFSSVKKILLNIGIERANGFLIDLGVSQHQLMEPSRGFSYNNDAPLDMRMSLDSEFSAYDVVNDYDESRLFKIISSYGEERWAKRIAQFIVRERETKPIETTLELVSVIKKAVPKAARSDGPHPAKRTFQAIRIEVNDELSIIENAIIDMADFLKEGGRICVISFHSLEDRIIKNIFRRLESPCDCPTDFPVCVCGKKPKLRVVTRKPILPGEAELKGNHMARSAKLRIAEGVRL